MRSLGWLALALAVSATAVAAAAQPPASAPAPWTAQCVARLDRARAELAPTLPWAARGRTEIEPTPWHGWFVSYASDDGRLTAMIEDYATGGAGPGWVPMGRGECFDERARPPLLAEVRNYDARQAQLQIHRAPAAARARIQAALHAALDECATYR